MTGLESREDIVAHRALRQKLEAEGESHPQEGEGTMGRKERSRYYNDNKEAIIADLLSIGRKATREKWGIPQGGTSAAMEKRWLTPEQRKSLNIRRKRGQETTRKVVDVVVDFVDLETLPPFPAFSDNWPMMVQMKWLEVYCELRKVRKGDE